MRLTIIPVDRNVCVDGETLSIDMPASVPANVHALQWYGDNGAIELTDDAPVEITVLPDWATELTSAWNDVMFPPPPPPPTPEEIATQEAEAEASRIASPWQAAHNLEYSCISGSAVGMVTMGIMQGLPKCIAVQAWITSIWSLYYERKANGPTDADYSPCGIIPYTIPEIMAELGI
jgi:hypothetical protein